MSYGLKYNCAFANKVTSYSLEIYEKDYGGGTTQVTGAYPVVKHSYQTDNPIIPIKGSSITAQLLNQSNTLPIDDFYSEDDQKFKAKLVWHSTLSDVTLFEGFIVLENSGEIMVDKRHPINLSANDNLGLLKGIPFNEALFQERTIFDTEFADVQGVAPNTLIITNLDITLLVGDVISITGTLSGVYNVTGVEGSTITVAEGVATVAVETVTIIVFRGDFYTLRTLLSIIHTCISSTGLELLTRVFANINEVTQDPADCFLEQTLIDPQTFNNGGNWDDCYSVLTKILVRWKLTLFQAKGVWNIVRWNELRYYDYSIPGFEYDSDFAFVQAVELNEADSPFTGWDKFLIGIGETSVAVEGLQRSITGADKFVQETMNYRYPAELLRNSNFQQLGNLITSYPDGGGNTISEYEVPWWYYTDAYPTVSGVNGPAVFFIRVTTDSVGIELDRYLLLKDNDIHSYPMPVSPGDTVRFSFSCITRDDFSTLSLFIKLTDGVDTVFAHALGSSPTWDTTTGYAVTVGVTADEWFNVDVETPAVPFEGLLTVYLRTFSNIGAGENLYNDVRVEYIPRINQSSTIIGHVHKNSQYNLIKAKEESEIFIDVTPRNSIAGTLFLDSVTVLQDRCGQWTRATVSENRNLGDIITFEDLFLKRISRTQLEDTFYGVLGKIQTISAVDYVNHISMLSVMRYTHFATLNFIFGRLEIDYSNNQFTGTLFEMYEDSEVDSDLAATYLFNYLFAKK